MDAAFTRPELSVVGGAATLGWEAVYRENVVPVFRFAFARTGNRPDAEDVTEQVFLRALPRLRLAAAAHEVRAYLFATARTVLADHWATRFGTTVVELDDEHLTATAAEPREGSDSDDDGESEAAVRAAALLERLPESHRRVLELRFLRGYSVQETAAEMGLRAGNVKVIQHRALRRAAQLGADAGR